MKKVLKTIFWLFVAYVAYAVIGLVITVLSLSEYTTTDIADYGKYIGNNNNKAPTEFITSFFPEEIDPSFSDVQYSYRAYNADVYSYEAYLEFAIKDEQQYEEFISKYTKELDKQEFIYDTSFDEYIISDYFNARPRETNEEGEIEEFVNIREAKIGKILCCDEQQRVIFVALGVYDGGVVTTELLTVYFDRFDIDPLQYAEGRDEFPKNNDLVTFP